MVCKGCWMFFLKLPENLPQSQGLRCVIQKLPADICESGSGSTGLAPEISHQTAQITINYIRAEKLNQTCDGLPEHRKAFANRRTLGAQRPQFIPHTADKLFQLFEGSCHHRRAQRLGNLAVKRLLLCNQQFTPHLFDA
jgi:hypothetical protein